MQVKNIIIVSDFGYVNGGNSRVAIQTALALEYKKFQVYFFCGTTPVDDELIKSTVRIDCIQQQDFYEGNGRLKGSVQGIWNFKAAREFYNYYKKLDKNQTVVHFHSWIRVLSPSVIYMAARMGFKIYFTVHDYNLFCPNGTLFIFPQNEVCYYRPLDRRCILCNCDRRKYVHKLYRLVRFLCLKYALRQVDHHYLVTISNTNDMICRQYCYAHNRTIKIVKNPTSMMNHIAYGRIEVEYNKSFLFIGRVSDEKGIRLFCEAITRGGYEGIVLGDGYLLDELRNKYNNIIFKGWCVKQEIMTYLKRSRALVFPSLWYEGAPLVIMEVMQHGIPCIVSDVSSASEIVDDGKNGFIFKSNDVESLSDTMGKIAIEQEENMRILSVNAQNTFAKHEISMEMYANELLKFYMT